MTVMNDDDDDNDEDEGEDANDEDDYEDVRCNDISAMDSTELYFHHTSSHHHLGSAITTNTNF